MTGFLTIALLSIVQDGVIKEVIVDDINGNSVILNLQYYLLYVVYFLSYVLIAVAVFMQSYRETKRARQVHLLRQLRSMITGMVVALLFGGFNLILPLMGNYSLIWAGPPFTILFVMALFYAIINQGLFDLRAALARSTAYFALLISLVVVYAF